MRKRAFGIAAALLAAAMLPSATLVVSASDGDNDAAAFAGGTTTLAGPVYLVGGSGTYSFASWTCVAVSSDGVAEAGPCMVASSGTYTNYVCGTGPAQGTTTVTEADGSSDNFSTSIQFVAGLGVMTGGGTGVLVMEPMGSPTAGVCMTAFDIQGVLVTS